MYLISQYFRRGQDTEFRSLMPVSACTVSQYDILLSFQATRLTPDSGRGCFTGINERLIEQDT